MFSGAGKTTTMGMLTAEFPPTFGDAVLAGFGVRQEPHQKIRQRIGYCPQFDALFENMTALPMNLPRMRPKKDPFDPCTNVRVIRSEDV